MVAPAEPSSHDQPASQGQNVVERVIERAVIVFAQTMVVVAIAAVVYGFLVMMFFFCCGVQGVDTTTYFNPARSPLGPAATVLLVWPVVGLLCLALQDGPGELLRLISKSVRRILHKSHPESGA